MDQITTRRATTDDLNDLADLWYEIRVLQQQSDSRLTLTFDAQIKWIEEASRWLTNPRCAIWIVLRDGNRQGYLVLWLQEMPPGTLPARMGYVSDMAVDLHSPAGVHHHARTRAGGARAGVVHAARRRTVPQRRRARCRGHHHAGDARFLCFCCRPHRGRSAGPSSPVAGDDRVDFPLLGQRSDFLRSLFLRYRVAAHVDDRELVERNDPDPRKPLLEQPAIGLKHELALEVVVVDLADGLAFERVEVAAHAAARAQLQAFGADDTHFAVHG